MALRLIIEDDEGATTVVPLGGEAVTIGRQEGNTIQLTEKNVSRRHARLWFEGGTWMLEDLGSYNGIKVNGEFIEAAIALKEGDVVQIGDYHLALAEDTSKVVLPRQSAANAGEEEPLLASSSAHLPVLAADEPAGDGTMAAAGSVEAAGATSVSEEPAGSSSVPEEEPVERRRGGAAIGIAAAVVLGLGGLGVVAFMGGGDRDPAEVASAGSQWAGPAGSPAERSPGPAAVPHQAPAEARRAKEAPNDAAAMGEEDVGSGPAVKPSAGGSPAGKSGDPGGVEKAARKSAAGSTRSKRRRKSKRGSRAEARPGPPPPPPTAPVKDPAALLKEARTAQMRGDAAKAYRLAAEANRARPSQAALRVMGAAACKMGDRSKAKRVYGRLTGTARADMAKLCKTRGVDLP